MSELPGMVSQKRIDQLRESGQDKLLREKDPTKYLADKVDESNESVQRSLSEVYKLVEKCMGALEQLKQNNPTAFNESVDNIFYYESNQSDARNVNSYIKLIMLHLFKLKYGKVKNSHIHLNKEIDNFREEIINIINWDDSNRLKKNIIKFVEEDFDMNWPRALRALSRVIKESPKEYRIKNTKGFSTYTPETWTFTNIMDMDTGDLISKLPELS